MNETQIPCESAVPDNERMSARGLSNASEKLSGSMPDDDSLLAWVLSDINLDATPPWKRGFPHPKPKSEIAIVCGNLGADIKHSINWLASNIDDRPVVLILGNRDRCLGDVDRAVDRARRAAAGTTVVVLENESLSLTKKRRTIIGATLWSDFRLSGNPEAAMALIGTRMSEFRGRSRNGQPWLSPRGAAARHEASRNFIEQTLRTASNRCVVATHFAPCPQAISSVGDHDMASYAASDLTGLMARKDDDPGFVPPTAWVHGHTLTTARYGLGDTMVVTNSKGRGPWRPDELPDNPEFDPGYVVSL
jgi:hypothetical protein